MEENNIIEIYNMIKIAADFLTHPEDKETVDALENLKAQMQIKSYLPIRQKEIAIQHALMSTDFDQLGYKTATSLEISFNFHCLLAYVNNIDINMSETFTEADCLDVLEISGIFEYIRSFCQKDLDVMRKMYDNAHSWTNIVELLDTIEKATPENIEKLTEEFEKFRVDTDPKIIKALSDILAHNDPILDNIKDNIESSIKNIEDTEEKIQ